VEAPGFPGRKGLVGHRRMMLQWVPDHLTGVMLQLGPDFAVSLGSTATLFPPVAPASVIIALVSAAWSKIAVQFADG